MEAPIEINHFTLNKTEDNERLNNLGIKIEINTKINPDEISLQDKDEQESSQNENTDSENNLVFIQSSNDSPKKRNTIKDFKMSYILGKGSYAKVVLASNIYTNKQYALKIIDKTFLEKENKEHEVHIEKYMLTMLNHPFIIKLYSTFQDKKKLYFILQYCPNRDFSDFIRSRGKLTKDLTKFYAAQIISALEYMGKKGVYHRDLKPENILLDEKMHLKICDFSTAIIQGMKFDKRIMKFVKAEEIHSVNENNLSGRRSEDDIGLEDSDSEEDKFYDISQDFVGTPEYVSPEVLSRKFEEIGRPVDLWALGCIIYRCLHGHTPFKDKTNTLIFEKILNVEYKLDEDLDKSSKDIIKKLLLKEPKNRLGAGDKDSGNEFSALKSHPFFAGLSWDTLSLSDPPIEIPELSMSTNGFKVFEDHNSLSPVPRTSRIEKKLNSFTEIPPFVINLNVVKQDEDVKEEIIYESLVQKKSPWFHYNTRILRLYSNSKMEYLDPKSLKTKGTIKFNHECEAIFLDESRFDLVTKNRTYIFKLNNKFAKTWVEKINKIIENSKV